MLDHASEQGLTEERLRSALAAQAETESRRATLPATPADYRLQVSQDFVLPEGFELVPFNENDPGLQQLRALAHAEGWAQSTFERVLGLYAGAQVAELQQFEAAKAAQLAQLGPTAQARTGAVNQWLTGMIGPDLAKGFTLAPLAAIQVRALETLIQKFSSQGMPPFSQAGREPGGGRGISDAAYERLSPAQRLDYARNPASFLTSHRLQD